MAQQTHCLNTTHFIPLRNDFFPKAQPLRDPKAVSPCSKTERLCKETGNWDLFCIRLSFDVGSITAGSEVPSVEHLCSHHCIDPEKFCAGCGA